MADTDNVTQNFNNVNNEVDKEITVEQLQDEMIKRLREEIVKKFYEYKTTLNFMASDAPIAILCLEPAIETALLNSGCLRIYDLFDLDFTKIKGLGEIRIKRLTSRMDQFLSML